MGNDSFRESISVQQSLVCVHPGAAVLHDARSSWLGRVSSVRLPCAVEEAAANSQFLFGTVSLHRGCSTIWLGWRAGPIVQVCYSQQSCANLLVSVLLLHKVLNENIKEKQEEREVALFFSLSLASAAKSKTTNACSCFEMFLHIWCFLCHMKNLVTPEPLFSCLPAPTCLLWKYFSLA